MGLNTTESHISSPVVFSLVDVTKNKDKQQPKKITEGRVLLHAQRLLSYLPHPPYIHDFTMSALLVYISGACLF